MICPTRGNHVTMYDEGTITMYVWNTDSAHLCLASGKDTLRKGRSARRSQPAHATFHTWYVVEDVV